MSVQQMLRRAFYAFGRKVPAQKQLTALSNHDNAIVAYSI